MAKPYRISNIVAALCRAVFSQGLSGVAGGFCAAPCHEHGGLEPLFLRDGGSVAGQAASGSVAHHTGVLRL